MKKGFTFIEIIVVIGLLGLMAVLVTTNTVALQGKQNEKEYKNYIETIENAACVYAEKEIFETNKDSCKAGNTSSCKITIDTLITNGLLDQDLKNIKKNIKITEEKAHIVLSYNDGVKTCTYTEE